MTAKSSFLITLRIFFVVFSLQFTRDALNKWDGFSFYMKFVDFLPSLSLAFILWTIFGITFATLFWLPTFGLLKIFPKSLKFIRFEHIIAGLLFVWLTRFIKETFIHFSVHELLGVSRSIIFAIAVVSMGCIVWFLRKYSEKMLHMLDKNITSLLWFFAILLILAVPFSFYKTKTPEIKSIPKDNSYANFSIKKRPNIILIVFDTLTARDMSLYGYNLPTTPFFSEWAKNAIVFNKAYSSSNATIPSTMSILTSQRPWTHHFYHFNSFYTQKKYENSLPKVLKDNGYEVYGFVQTLAAHPKSLGIDGAFLVKDDSSTFWIERDWGDKIVNLIKNDIVRAWIFDSGFIADIFKKLRPGRYVTDAPPEKVYDRFLDYISEINSHDAPPRPFFAFIQLYPPHALYLPPEPYIGKFGDAERFRTEKEQDELILDPEYEPERQKDVDILRKRYDEHILYSDQTFKSFMSRLAEIIDLSNTIIIFASDHGESFSHGYQGHVGPHLYESLVHVPLIIKIPEKVVGKEINIPVEIIDIAPTILEFADIPAPEWMEGRSLVPLLKDKSLELRPIFSMQIYRNRLMNNAPITKGTLAVWDGDYKLIDYLDEKKLLLFNLRTDPDEKRNIFSEQPEIAQRLKRLIDDNLSLANKKIAQSVE